MSDALKHYSFSSRNSYQPSLQSETQPETTNYITTQNGAHGIVNSSQSLTASESLTVDTNIEDRITEVVINTQKTYEDSSIKIDMKKFFWNACYLLGSLLKVSAAVVTIYHMLYFAIALSSFILSGGAASSFLAPLVIALGTTVCILCIFLLQAGISYKQKQADTEKELLANKIIALDILGNILLETKNYTNCNINNDNIQQIVENFSLIETLAQLFIKTNSAKHAKIQEDECYEGIEDTAEKSITIESIKAKQQLDELSKLSVTFFTLLFKTIEFKTDNLEDKIQEAKRIYIEQIIKSSSEDKLINVIKKSIKTSIQKIAKQPEGVPNSVSLVSLDVYTRGSWKC